jgi:hypothetical protein
MYHLLPPNKADPVAAFGFPIIGIDGTSSVGRLAHGNVPSGLVEPNTTRHACITKRPHPRRLPLVLLHKSWPIALVFDFLECFQLIFLSQRLELHHTYSVQSNIICYPTHLLSSIT